MILWVSTDAQNYMLTRSLDDDGIETILNKRIFIDFNGSEVQIYTKGKNSEIPITAERYSTFIISDVTKEIIEEEEYIGYTLRHIESRSDKYYVLSVLELPKNQVLIALYSGDDIIVLKGYR